MGTDFLDDTGRHIPVDFDDERSLIFRWISKFFTPVRRAAEHR